MQINLNDLHGTWKLIDFTITTPDGKEKQWGPKTHGMIMYQPNGYMSMAINSGADLETCMNDLDKHVLFYSGTYTLSNATTLAHRVMNATNPDRIGKTFLREAELMDQKHLTLRASGDYGRAQLRWEKI